MHFSYEVNIGVNTRKRSTVVSKSEVDLWLKSVSLLEVTGEIRMGDIVMSEKYMVKQ